MKWSKEERIAVAYFLGIICMADGSYNPNGLAMFNQFASEMKLKTFESLALNNEIGNPQATNRYSSVASNMPKDKKEKAASMANAIAISDGYSTDKNMVAKAFIEAMNC